MSDSTHHFNIDVFPHTVFLAVGPTNCGKSTFIQRMQWQIETTSSASRLWNVQILSSDSIRQELMSEKLHKHNPRMLHASESAFKLLHLKLDELMKFPIKAEAIFVDTTGLSESFRNKIIAQARAAHYRIEMLLFNYDDRQDYYRMAQADDEVSKTLITQHVNRFRREVLGKLGRRDYNGVHRISQISYPQVNLPNHESYARCFGQKSLKIPYTIIGDIHGCPVEFKELLEKNGFTFDENGVMSPRPEFPDHRVVLVGDLIDKGPDSLGVLRIAAKNLHIMDIVNCNHGHYVRNFNPETDGLDPVFRNTYFDSVKKYEGNEEFKELLEKVYDHAVPFFQTERFIVTHALCFYKHLGKLDKESMKRQRNSYTAHGKDYPSIEAFKAGLEKDLVFIKKESVSNHPLHIFGHNVFGTTFQVKNRIFLDTGCVHGNRLTSVTVNTNGSLFYEHVESKDAYMGDSKVVLPRIFDVQEMVRFETLDPKDRGRIFYGAKEKLNFISGTMSPSDKDPEQNSLLETLGSAFSYYREQGIKRVVMQPKYMGSRGTMYLNRDPEKRMITTRNGYPIKDTWVDVSAVMEKTYQENTRLFADPNVESVLIDGELMPWSALGKPLIERQYRTIHKAIKLEAEFLKRSGFKEKIQAVREEFEKTYFTHDAKHMSGKDLSVKYGARYETYQTFSVYEDFNWDDNDAYIESFGHQLKVHGEPGDAHFLPFCWLKTIYKDGTETSIADGGYNNLQCYNAVASPGAPKAIEVDLDDPKSVELALWLYRTWVAANMEGAVVKPYEIQPQATYAPYLKVRNPEYLRLIYGYDYTQLSKFQKLYKQKSIRGKLRTSIREWNIGMEMLKIRAADISTENAKYVNLMAKMIQEEKSEQFLDPRL